MHQYQFARAQAVFARAPGEAHAPRQPPSEMQAILHYCVLIGTEGSTQFLHARNFCMHTAGSCSMLFPCASHGRKQFLRAHCRHTHICALEAVNLQHGQARSTPSSYQFMRAHCRHTQQSAHWKPSTCSMGKHDQLHRATNLCGHTAGTRTSAHWKPPTRSMNKHEQIHRTTHLCGHTAGTRIVTQLALQP